MADEFRPGAIFAELAPTPKRWLRSARVASISALGAGVMATMQIANPLGLTMLVNLALPEAAFSLTRGMVFLCCAAVLQTLALAVAGALVNSPPLDFAAFILVSLVTSYLIYAVPILGRLWVWTQVPVVTGFYLVLFVPNQLGWDNAQMFSGVAIAVMLLLLFNNLIWPEPVQVTLADSLAEMITRSRSRLARVLAIATGDAESDKDKPVASQLGHHLALLSQAGSRASRPAGRARLLLLVIRAERIRTQVDRITRSLLGASSRRLQHASTLRELAAEIDAGFERMISQLRNQVADPTAGTMRSPSAPSRDLKLRLREIAVANPELVSLTSLIEPLATLLQDDVSELPDEDDGAAEPLHLSIHGANAFLMRFAARHTLALALAFVLGLWDNSPQLHAAIWLLMLGGPPSHGATPQKFTMRALGSSGAIALAALGTIVVAPNFTSLPSYMAVIFVGVLLMTYIGEGGGILSYLAIGGTAFVIAYSGPGPRSDVLASIWSVWGISLGMIIRAALTLIWREHSYQTLAEEFQAPFAAILEMTNPGRDSTDQSLSSARMKVAASIQGMLGVANDALLEGRSAGIDPANLIDALETLLRLAFTIGKPARTDPGDQPALSHLVIDAIRSRMQAWLESLRTSTENGTVRPAPLRRMIAEATVPPLHVSLPAEADESNISTQTKFDLQAVNLMRLLETQLSSISLIC